jgi:IPT/TIG domain
VDERRKSAFGATPTTTRSDDDAITAQEGDSNMTIIATCRPDCTDTVAVSLALPPCHACAGGAFPLDALAIISLNPDTAVCLTADVLVTATGQNFTATTEILFGGVPIALAGGRATYVDPTTMTFTAKPSAYPTPTTVVVTCRDTPGYGAGMGSCDFKFTAAPLLTVTCPLQPASALVNAPALTVTVKGTLFTASSIVMVDNVDQATTYVNATTLTFQFTPGATARTVTVSVKDGANTAATTCPFQVTTTPLLTVVCPVVPATAVAGSTTPLTVTVNGTNFTVNTRATVDGVDQTTTFISATSISFPLTIPATVATIQTLQIGARDGTATAAVTCPFTITPVATLLPIITCPLVPATAVAGTADLQVTVNGQNFNSNCVVRLDGATAPGSTYVSATQMRFTMPMRTETTARQAIVSVYDTVAAVGTVATCPFEVTAIIRPTVTYVFPDQIGYPNEPVKTITVDGTNFDNTTTIILGGAFTEMVTTYVSPTRVTFVTVSPMWTNGNMELRARNGGIVQGMSTVNKYLAVRNSPGNDSPVNILPTSAPANSGVVRVQLGASGTGTPYQVMVDGLPAAPVDSSFFDIDTTGKLPGTVMQCTVRLGHQHPEGHDDIYPIPPQLVPFTIT